MKIETLGQIRAILGNPNPVLSKKIYHELNVRMVRFIQHAPLVFISTVDAGGFPTISPKGDAPGFIDVEDSSSLLIPERKGNKLAYTFDNILSGSKVALLFVVPGTNEVLRVHGSAELYHDPVLNKKYASKSQDALLVTRVTVHYCYFHCGKAFLRSRVFLDDIEYQNMEVSFGKELSENNAFSKEQADSFDEGVKGRYKTDL